MFLIEDYFWKDGWLNEEPTKRMYGTKEEAINYLKREFENNKQYKPTLDLENLELNYSTDARRNYMTRCFDLQPVSDK